MEKYDQAKESRTKIFVNNFLGGIAWAWGAIVGVALIAMLLTLILKNINLVPFFGNYISKIIEFIIQKNPNLFVR